MEQNPCYQVMNQLVLRAEQVGGGAFLGEFEERYALKEFKISQITPSYAAEIYHDIFIKFMKNYSPKSELHWGQNELRLFMWILAQHLQIEQLTIDQLGEKDWQYFCDIFPNKQNILFQYQTISLFRQATPAKKWTAQQDEIFSALVRNKDGKYKWSELAKELYITSNREYFRTPKQCRERWLNHLDPNKSKDEWQLKEDYVLISHVLTKGKKWAEISKLLKNRRNQHSIKNRFKSLITKEQKLHPDIKDQTVLVELISRKYSNHFSKMRIVHNINEHAADKQHSFEKQHEVKMEDMIPTSTNLTDKELISREVFRVIKEGVKVEHPEHGSQLSISENISNRRGQREEVLTVNFMEDAFRYDREKQIRADMFLSEDPFDFLKRFFKSKDRYQLEQ